MNQLPSKLESEKFPQEEKCELDHCHICAGCGYERPMTESEAEIAKGLDEVFAEPMSGIETVLLNNVEVQANGIIRNEKGRLIARLVDSCGYESEHIKGLSVSHTPPEEEWVEKVSEAAHNVSGKEPTITDEEFPSIIRNLLHSEREKVYDELTIIIENAEAVAILESGTTQRNIMSNILKPLDDLRDKLSTL